MRKIETKTSERKKQLIKKIIVWIIIAIILGLILTAALGNLKSIKTLWKTP